MSLDDDQRYRPESGGGQEDGVSAEFSITDFLAFWKRWKRRGEQQQAAPLSWTEQQEEKNRRKVDEEMARVTGETENQRRLREKEGT